MAGRAQGKKKHHTSSEARRRQIQGMITSLSQASASFGQAVVEAVRADESIIAETCGSNGSIEDLTEDAVLSMGVVTPPPAEHPGSSKDPGSAPAGDDDRGREAEESAAQREERAIVESGVVQALMHDYCVMQANQLEYDSALQTVTQEVTRMRLEVLHLERLGTRAGEIQDLIGQEKRKQEELHRQNAELTRENGKLLSILHSALDMEGDAELDAFTDGLVLENDTLWKMVNASQIARRISASSLQMPPLPRRRRPSWGSRSARSSAPSSPSKPLPARVGSQGDEEALVEGQFDRAAAVRAGQVSPGLRVDEEELEDAPFVESSIFVHAPRSTGSSERTARLREVPCDGSPTIRLQTRGPVDDEAGIAVDGSSVQTDVDLSSLACLEHADEAVARSVPERYVGMDGRLD